MSMSKTTYTNEIAAGNAPALQSGSALEIWNIVQTDLLKRLGDRVHKSWTGQLSFFGANDTTVALTAPSKFIAGRIDAKYGDLVKTLWAQHDSRLVEIGAGSEINLKKLDTPPPALTHAIQNPVQSSESDLKTGRFTFDNFVLGPSNELAYAVAKRVAQSDDCQYNPILIHGPHGMGKTHLLHAVRTKALENNPGRRVRLISSEQFVGSFVQSVRASGRGEIEAFKAGLRDVDLLIIDDAHFIADKPGSQEELLHTLISLVDAGKQILLASDRHPHAITKASERLKSYLCGGLLCDIGAADYDLRLRILDRLIEKRRSNGHPSLAMPQNARDHLAARINATPRDLEGAFNQVVARSEFLGRPLTLESVQEALEYTRYSGGTRPTVDKIQRITAKEFGISLDEMMSKRRARSIARPRQIAMYLSKMLTTRSLPDIGRRFGGRDHTTVIHAVKRVDTLRAEDSNLNAHVEKIIEALKSE
ncbi:MAG: chromosomal replication initiator protein DnaA [Acidimicrobiales bacterium]|nr:chromosomal replication initiator protein DnaA [Hyphomonadaceae bacterium]RZV41159.1 MAG: chromosomal replication initiator protein DnaA [Acidimicrobiales bacterium]